jgi:hypothetical protein
MGAYFEHDAERRSSAPLVWHEQNTEKRCVLPAGKCQAYIHDCTHKYIFGHLCGHTRGRHSFFSFLNKKHRCQYAHKPSGQQNILRRNAALLPECRYDMFACMSKENAFLTDKMLTNSPSCFSGNLGMSCFLFS